MWPFSLLSLSRRGRSARRLIAAREQVAAQAERDARKVARAAARFDARHPYVAPVEHYNDGALLEVRRGGRTERRLRVGPNEVHALVAHADGSYEDLGVSTNLLTNIGRDALDQVWGFIPVQNAPATATSATSITGTGTTWTASNLATPQLGLAGLRVVAPVTGLTTAPCYGNIVSNTTGVATIDQWWKADDTVATTPASTNSFIIMPGGVAAVRFIAISTNASAASAANTTLANEVTTNGGGRALGTYAHTMGATTLTLTKAFSITGTITAAHRAGLFSCLTSAGADPQIFDTVMNADATVVNGDTLTLTWTITLSG